MIEDRVSAEVGDLPLDRFIEAQQPVYEDALAELRAGAKRGHWMWFVFPQIAGLGRSQIARHYALKNLQEARDYTGHDLLRPRLRECVDAVLHWSGRRNALEIFGSIDTLKLGSSMTLFEKATGEAAFGTVIDGFFAGRRDQRTLDLVDE